MLGLIQFMLVLDITVVNVALPRIQDDLGFSRSGLAWVVNGYVLMAGGLLLLGGRLADILGRRRLFLLGVGVFAIASATCGAAADPARTLQYFQRHSADTPPAKCDALVQSQGDRLFVARGRVAPPQSPYLLN